LFLLVIRPPHAGRWSHALELVLRELGGERLGEGVFTIHESREALERLEQLVAQLRCEGGDAMIACGVRVETGNA